MNPSKALVILLFVAALVTGIWLVLEESPPSLKVLGTDGTENTQAADLSSATPDQPAAIAPPTRDAVERSVKVVDTNGDVVVGVRVSYQLTSGQREYKNFARMEEQLEEMQAMDFATSFLGSPYLVSDSDGLAHLAEDGFGLVFADTGKMSGLALVDKPGVGKPKQYVLQLSPYPSLPIQVINADGTPAPGMTVDLLYTKKDDEPNNSQRWQWRNGLAHSLPTDATGFTSIRMDPASSLKVRNQNIDQVNLQIAILEGLVTPLIQDVQIDQTELLILRLPRCGSVEVRLSGYPANFFPKLVLMEDNEPGLFPGLIALSPQEIKGKNGVWSFPRVALNKEYSVQIFRFAIQRKGSQSQTSQSRTELPTKQFSGPIRAGESVSVEMEYLKGAWLTGRILQADGKPIKTGRYMGKFYFQAGKGGQITPNMKLEADVAAEGTFVIPAPDEDQLLGLKEELDQLFVEHVPENVMWGPNPIPFQAPTRKEIALPGSDYFSTYDLGDIQLEAHAPLLTVTVKDEAGEPVPQAQLNAEYLRLHKGATKTFEIWNEIHAHEWSWPGGSNGIIRVYGRSWKHLAFGNRRSSSDGELPPFNEIKLTVRQNNYLPKEVTIPITQTELDVVLSAAASLTGSVLDSPKFNQIQVAVVSAGAAVDTNDRALKRQRVRRNSNGKNNRKPSTFEFRAVQPGIYDVVFMASLAGGELHRVSGVSIEVGKNTDPRLENVDLLPFMDFVELEILDPDGIPFDQPALESKGGCVRRWNSEWTTGQGCTWNFSENRLWIEVPRGEKLHAEIDINGFIEFKIKGWAAGSYQVQLHAMKPVTLTFNNYSSMPAGSIIEVSIGDDIGGHWKLKNSNSNPESWSGEIARVGKFSIYLNLGGHRSSRLFMAPIEITEQAIQSGEPVLTEVPQEFIDYLVESGN